MVNFDCDVDTNANANVKCEHTFKLHLEGFWCWSAYGFCSRTSDYHNWSVWWVLFIMFGTLSSIFYRPQRSWGKVIFLQASVILLTGGGLVPGGCLVLGGVCSCGGPWGSTPRMATAAGNMHPTGMHSCAIKNYRNKISPNAHYLSEIDDANFMCALWKFEKLLKNL